MSDDRPQWLEALRGETIDSAVIAVIFRRFNAEAKRVQELRDAAEAVLDMPMFIHADSDIRERLRKAKEAVAVMPDELAKTTTGYWAKQLDNGKWMLMLGNVTYSGPYANESEALTACTCGGRDAR